MNARISIKALRVVLALLLLMQIVSVVALWLGLQQVEAHDFALAYRVLLAALLVAGGLFYLNLALAIPSKRKSPEDAA